MQFENDLVGVRERFDVEHIALIVERESCGYIAKVGIKIQAGVEDSVQYGQRATDMLPCGTYKGAGFAALTPLAASITFAYQSGQP